MSWSSWSIPNPQSAKPMILRSLASSGQKFLSLDKLKLTSLNSWKLPERLLPSCRRSAMVHGSICLNPHFPASTRSRYIVTTLSLHHSCHSCHSCHSYIATKLQGQNQTKSPAGQTTRTAHGSNVQGSARQRRATVSAVSAVSVSARLSSSQLVGKRWVSTRVKSCFNGASTEVYNVLSSA